MEEQTIRLTPEQTLEAICADFRQYDPQMMLFAEVMRLVAGPDWTLVREPGRDGAWVRVENRRNRQWLEGQKLIAYMCDMLRRLRPGPQDLAAAAARVFHTRTQVVEQPGSGATIIQIRTGMEAFVCRQCGQCCKNLDYRYEITTEDVLRWEKAGRGDILEWVGVTRHRDGRRTYQIWVVPGTNRIAKTCPFLRAEPTTDRVLCSIHADKPDICRNYPVSRKHALMTGCPGFSNQRR